MNTPLVTIRVHYVFRSGRLFFLNLSTCTARTQQALSLSLSLFQSPRDAIAAHDTPMQFEVNQAWVGVLWEELRPIEAKCDRRYLRSCSQYGMIVQGTGTKIARRQHQPNSKQALFSQWVFLPWVAGGVRWVGAEHSRAISSATVLLYRVVTESVHKREKNDLGNTAV